MVLHKIQETSDPVYYDPSRKWKGEVMVDNEVGNGC